MSSLLYVRVKDYFIRPLFEKIRPDQTNFSIFLQILFGRSEAEAPSSLRFRSTTKRRLRKLKIFRKTKGYSFE